MADPAASIGDESSMCEHEVKLSIKHFLTFIHIFSFIILPSGQRSLQVMFSQGTPTRAGGLAQGAGFSCRVTPYGGDLVRLCNHSMQQSQWKGLFCKSNSSGRGASAPCKNKQHLGCSLMKCLCCTCMYIYLFTNIFRLGGIITINVFHLGAQ